MSDCATCARAVQEEGITFCSWGASPAAAKALKCGPPWLAQAIPGLTMVIPEKVIHCPAKIPRRSRDGPATVSRRSRERSP
jgi:hypothetical protein